MHMQTMMHTITLQQLWCEAAWVVCTEWGEETEEGSTYAHSTRHCSSTLSESQRGFDGQNTVFSNRLDPHPTPPHTHPLLHAIPGDHTHLRCKVCHVFLLLLQSSLGHKNGEVAVGDSKLLDLSVHKLCSDKERH